MALKTTIWDPSEYLDSPESVAAYLEAAFEDGDPLLSQPLSVASHVPSA